MIQLKTFIFLAFLVFNSLVFTLGNKKLRVKSQFKSTKLANKKTNDLQEFCWKDTYFRGVGTIPTECGEGKVKIGLLCYSECPSGYKRFGFDCYQTCPSGWSDQSLFCRLPEYGRGAGYPWKFGDGFNDNGMKKRCENDHGVGKCEKNGLIFYPKCKSGFYNFGCCICRPSAPNCSALGFNGGIDLSCAKKIKIGDPKPMDCRSGTLKNAGLCYTPCKDGYNGIGNICWGKAPSGWVDCGMGAAKDSLTCGTAVTGQIVSVVKLTINAVTLGMSCSANQSATAAEKSVRVTAYSSEVKALLNYFEKNKDAIKSAVQNFNGLQTLATNLYDIFSHNDGSTGTWDDITIEDITRIVADFLAVIDTTGIANVVSQYTYPKCSKYFG